MTDIQFEKRLNPDDIRLRTLREVSEEDALAIEQARFDRIAGEERGATGVPRWIQDTSGDITNWILSRFANAGDDALARTRANRAERTGGGPDAAVERVLANIVKPARGASGFGDPRFSVSPNGSTADASVSAARFAPIPRPYTTDFTELRQSDTISDKLDQFSAAYEARHGETPGEGAKRAFLRTILGFTHRAELQETPLPDDATWEEMAEWYANQTRRSKGIVDHGPIIDTSAAPPGAIVERPGGAEPNVTQMDIQARNGLVNSSIAAGANAADKFRPKPGTPKGLADFFLGGNVSDWVRDFIGWENPMWKRPGGALDIMRSMVEVSDPTLSGLGQFAKAGNIARTKAAEAAQLERELSVLEGTSAAKQNTALANLIAAQAPPDLTGPIATTIKESGLQQNALGVIDKYMALLDHPSHKGKIGGLPKGAWDTLRNVARASGFDVGPNSAETARNLRGHLFTALVPIMGERFNKTEFNKLWDEILKKPNVWSSDSGLYKQLKNYRELIQSQLTVSNKIILESTGRGIGDWTTNVPLIKEGVQEN